MRKRAFTLIELLVVVGIITVLIAILMPVLRNARDAAITTKCASNIRQVMLAMSAYEVDYKAFPIMTDRGYGMEPRDSSMPKCWTDALVDGHYLTGSDFNHGQLGVFACPAVSDYDTTFASLSILPHYGYSVYVFPRAHPVGDHNFFGRRSRMSSHSDEKILLAEIWGYDSTVTVDGTKVTGAIWRSAGGAMGVDGSGWDDHIGYNSTVFHNAKVDLRHDRGNGANVCYMDGHVQLVVPPSPHHDPADDDPVHPFARAKHFWYSAQ